MSRKTVKALQGPSDQLERMDKLGQERTSLETTERILLAGLLLPLLAYTIIRMVWPLDLEIFLLALACALLVSGCSFYLLPLVDQRQRLWRRNMRRACRKLRPFIESGDQQFMDQLKALCRQRGLKLRKIVRCACKEKKS